MFRKLKAYGKRVASGGKWTVAAGVLTVAVGAGLLFSPIGPAVAAGALTAIAVGSIVSYAGGGAYLLGKLAYPVTKVFASIKRGPKAFFGEVGRGLGKLVTSALKIGGTVLMAGAVITAAVAISVASFGAAAPAAIGIAGAAIPAIAGGLGVTAAIYGGIGAAGLLLGKVGDKIIRSIPRVKWGRRRRESNVQSGGSRSRPSLPPTQPPPRQSATEKLGQKTTPQLSPAVTSHNERPRKDPPQPALVSFSQVLPNELQQLKNHTFEVESNDGNQTVIHKMGDQYQKRYICANGKHCPENLTPGQKLNLNPNDHGIWSFQPPPVQSKEAEQRSAHR
ncbi:MAG TPA: hypothetical protein VM532_05100 [Burkholderiales bacterium]|nr:hypothetical protein [Burkholderiales bacterium]